jgi:hypothetical protein
MDHVNGDRADNRWCNLREAMQSQNQANTSMRADNIFGYKGVCWHKGHRKWTAKIQVSGERRYLGYFDTPERAFIAYMFAAWKHHGDFALIDSDYLVALRRLKAREEFETRILWNLANQNPNYMAA